MELACHIRDVGQLKKLDEIPGHLINLYGQNALGEEDRIEEIPGSFDRVYIGDEFCINRLPSLPELEVLYQFVEKKGLGVTFLTPYLTDEGLERCSPLFDYLKKRDPRAEVVVSDWGSLFFFREKYPLFQLAVGRLLDKGFKDPRLLDADKASLFSRETSDLLNKGTFDAIEFQEKMLKLGVSRVERDLFPYGGHDSKSSSTLKTSFYFPFGYITTGRVCWLASFRQPDNKKFAISKGCDRICNTLTLKLSTEKSSFQLIQGGNTVFYLYTQAMLGSLMERAKRENLRLVYQGVALHP